MDIIRSLDGKNLTGINGVFQHIVDGVLKDPRWFLKWTGWNGPGTVRTIDLCFTDGANPNPVTDIHIEISETFRGVSHE